MKKKFTEDHNELYKAGKAGTRTMAAYKIDLIDYLQRLLIYITLR